MALIMGEQLDFVETPGGNAGAGLATPSRGASEVSVIRQRQQPGGTNPPHTHDREEVMVLLAGSVTVSVDGVAEVVSAGDTVIIPPRTLHQVENTGGVPAEWLLVAPAGVQFFHASGEVGSPPWAA